MNFALLRNLFCRLEIRHHPAKIILTMRGLRFGKARAQCAIHPHFQNMNFAATQESVMRAENPKPSGENQICVPARDSAFRLTWNRRGGALRRKAQPNETGPALKGNPAAIRPAARRNRPRHEISREREIASAGYFEHARASPVRLLTAGTAPISPVR